MAATRQGDVGAPLKFLKCQQRGPWEGTQDVAPNYWCDLETEDECCDLLMVQNWQFEKRMLGYSWYGEYDLWAKGLKWPGGGSDFWFSKQRKHLGVPDHISFVNAGYWRKRIADELGGISTSKLEEIRQSLVYLYPWRNISQFETLKMYYEMYRKETNKASDHGEL